MMSINRVYHSPFPNIGVPRDQSISEFLLSSNPDDVSPDRPILSDFDDPGHTVTYGELRKKAALYAAGLKRAFDLKETDVVCIYGQNSVHWSLLAHAIMWAGACCCAINPLATSYELVHYFRIAKPRVVIADAQLLPAVQEALPKLSLYNQPSLATIHSPGTSTPAGILEFPRDIAFSREVAMLPFSLAGRDNRKSPAAMCFSSGTSGKPKGVVLSHYNLIAYMLTVRSTNPFTHSAHTREVFFPSFAHIYGLVSGVILPAWAGCYLVAMREFEFMSYLRRCAQIKATILRLVPATAIRLTKDPAVKQLDLRNVKTLMCSGASLSAETVQDLQGILSRDMSILNGYGMTEGSIAVLRETQTSRAGCVGRAMAGVSFRIVDESFNDVPIGTDGEILFKAPTVFMEYKDDPEATSNTLRDGWLCTGDVGNADKDGFLWLTGRKKELIKYKGNQIAPAELEAVLLTHPLVIEAGVCGILDKGRDTEIPLGCVVLAGSVSRAETNGVLRELEQYVHTRVAPYKRLRGGLFSVKQLPKTTTGKLVRREIPAQLAVAQKTQAKL